MATQKLNPYNNNVSLHLLILALDFTTLIYKMVKNCADAIAIGTCVITSLKNVKNQRFIYLKQ